MFVSSSSSPVPPAAAGAPAPRVIPTPSSSSPLSARQLGSRPRTATWRGGLTFTLNLPNLTPPLCIAPNDSYASDPIPAYYALSSVRAWPRCCVKSQVQVPGRVGHTGPRRATPGHAGSRRTSTDQIWQAVGINGGGGEELCLLLISYWGSVRGGWPVVWGWAGVRSRGQFCYNKHVCCSWGFHLLSNGT